MEPVIGPLTSLIYRNVAKPIMFSRPPDEVHQRVLQLGSRVQKYRLCRRLVALGWSYRDEARLGQTINGIYFSNPVGLSAGFDKNFELMPLLKAIGFGHAEGGSLTYRECSGNPRPWFFRLPKTGSLVVHAGLANQGVERLVERIKRYPGGTWDNFPLNISVAKTNSPETVSDDEAIADYVGSLKVIAAGGVGNLITINISCPNTFGGEPFTTPAKLGRLLDAIDRLELDKPVFIKMPSNLAWDDFHALTKEAAGHRVAGLIIANLAKDRSKIGLKDPLPDDTKGSFSGRPAWGPSNELIRRTRLAHGERFTIIGVGGIFSADDAYTKIRLGANLVSLITGMIFEGPQLIGDINRGLAARLQRDGYNNIAEAVGADL